MSNASSTVYHAFCRTVDRNPQAAFIHIPAAAAASYAKGAVDLSYGEAARLVELLIPRYRGSGLKPGQRAALLLDNRIEFFVHWLALNALGVSIVPLNAEGSTADMAHVVRDSGVVMAVVLPERRGLIKAAAPGLPLHVIDSAPSHALQAKPNAGPDECSLVYTSGSTGAPKGCMLSNKYFLTFGTWYIGVGGLCDVRTGQERLITPLPLTHMNALACSTMAMLLSGGCVVQLDRFHPRSWWQTVAESRATIVHYLGVMPAMLLQIPEGEHERRHVLRFGFGAGVHPSHHKAFEDRFGFPLLESWSMTEVGAGAAMVANAEPRHVGTRCFGRPSDAMEYRLVSAQGTEVAEGETGELQVRAAGVDPRAGFFSGYAGRPDLTQEVWADGWFRTGDMVRTGEDGSLHFVDRSKSIVRRSGENIASLEVEAVLNQVAGVRAVGVGPVDDELRGEEVMACVELSDGFEPTSDMARQIFDAAGQELSYFKVPGYIAFVPALPLTTSQKLQRGELKTMARALVGSGDAFDLRHLKKRSSGGHH